MPEILIRPRAREDLKAIWRYTLRTGASARPILPAAAGITAFGGLADFRSLAYPAITFAPSIGSCHVSRPSDLYRRDDSRVEIVRFLHQAWISRVTSETWKLWVRAARQAKEELPTRGRKRTPRDQRELPQLASRAPRELRYERGQFGCRGLMPVAPGVSATNFRWRVNSGEAAVCGNQPSSHSIWSAGCAGFVRMNDSFRFGDVRNVDQRLFRACSGVLASLRLCSPCTRSPGSSTTPAPRDSGIT